MKYTMNFHSTVILIAFVFLILCLIGVGMALQTGVTITSAPKNVGECPDGWSKNAEGHCVIPSGGNKGNITNATLETYNTTYEIFLTNPPVVNGALDFSGVSVCDKQRWAKFFNVVWDGISNVDRCLSTVQ